MSVLKAIYVRESAWVGLEGNRSRSPLSALESAGPDTHVSTLAEGMKRESFRGAPGTEISLASFDFTPVVSPLPLV